MEGIWESSVAANTGDDVVRFYKARQKVEWVRDALSQDFP
jgi:hypothetical protein